MATTTALTPYPVFTPPKPIPSVFSFLKDSDTYKYLGDIGETLSFYANRIKIAENTGQLYKIVPLAIGTYFGYQGAKGIARGTVGYDSIDARAKMVGRAINEKELSYTHRLSLVRDSIFGSMSGKQRARILARGISNTLIAAAFFYPFFSMNTNETVDLNQRASSFPNDKNFLDAGVMGRSRDHSLDVAADLYAQKGPVIQQAILNPKVDPKMQSFAETILNPDEAPIANSFKSRIKQTCDWTIGWTAYDKVCDYFSGSAHQLIFKAGDNGFTEINAGPLEKACTSSKDFIKDSPADLGTQTADFLGSVCESTWGHTPWGKQCQDIRATLGPNAADRTQKLSTFVDQFCNDLTSRSSLGNSYKAIFNLGSAKTPEELSLASQAIIKLSTATVKGLTTVNGDAQNVLGLIGNQHPKEFQELTRSMMNITIEDALTKKIVKAAYRKIQLIGHPDKVKDDRDLENLGAAGIALMEAFNNNPNLYTGRTTHTFEELGKMFTSFFENYETAQKAEQA